ncbi:hypothetical protein PspLS_07392 [Pyricularia sp. CBS 133598]|nr:hypothetical protein PspLS_07392 [Pyricularia sp. CBS 133598]
MAQSTLDINQVRGSFPALSVDQVFFDNAGGSQTLGKVIDSIREYLSNTNVQLGASYSTGQKSTSLYDKGYEAAAKYINASVDNIVLGSSTTQLFRNLAQTLNFSQGDEIIVSKIDHEANIAAWADLAERQKLVLKWWLPSQASLDTSSPKLEVADLKGLLSDKTRFVTLTHASNILGTIHDVKAVSAAVHAQNDEALVCVDGVAYAPHRPIDVKALGVDIYCFSWYKVYGPHISMLYASDKANSKMKSLGHYFNPSKTVEDKLGLAGSSYELVASIPEVVAYLDSKEAAVEKQETLLSDTLLKYLRSRDDVTIWGEKSSDGQLRVPTISFTFKGWGSQELVEAVEKGTNFGFRWGSFYSVRLVEEMLGLGHDGIIRVSMVHYNTVDEVERLVEALDKTLASKK